MILSYSLGCSIKRSQSGRCLVFNKGEGSRKWEFVKKTKFSWRLTKSEYWERHGNTLLCTHKPTHTNIRAQSWWIIPLGCWEISYSEVIQLWHHGSALCVIRFTIMSDMQEVTQLTTLWNTCRHTRDKQKRQRWRFCCKQLATDHLKLQ